ncbi:MAG TPA: hypothetical protein VFU27_15410 [Terriglobales bacterium]|nr:hypothetical protein [Terriglobales bacterium]
MLIVAAFGIRAYKHGYNVAQTIAYLTANFGYIFVLWIALAFALLGVVASIDFASGRTHISKPTPQIVRWAVAFVLIIISGSAPVGFIFWHPLGYLWSIVIAFVVLALGLLLSRRLVRGISPQCAYELGDKMLKGTDDPNEAAREAARLVP